MKHINSLTSGRQDNNFKSVIPEHKLEIEYKSTSCEISLR